MTFDMVEVCDPVRETREVALRAWQTCAGRNAPLYTQRREELWPMEVAAYFKALEEGVAG